MNKSVKIFAIIVAIVIILPILAVIGAKLYFNSDRLKAMILPKVEEQISRNVSIDKISLKIFPNLKLDLTGLEISNPQGQEFASSTFVRLDKLTVDVQLRPLLKKQLRIDEISLVRPEVYLEVKKDGSTNYLIQPKGAEKSAPAEKPAAEGESLAMFIPVISMTDGTIEYTNFQSDQHLLVKGLFNDVALEVSHGGKQVVIQNKMVTEGISYGSTKSYLISNLPLNVYQEVTYKGDEDKLYIDSVQVAIKEIALDMSGTVSSVQTNPTLDLSLTSTKADIEQLLSLVPDEFMQASEGITTKGTFQFAMTVKGEAGEKKQPEIKGNFDVTNGTIQYPGLPKAITNVNVKGQFLQPATADGKSKPGQLTIETFAANLGNNKINGKLSVSNFDDPTLKGSFNGNLNLDEIKDYYPLQEDLTLSGSMLADISIDGKAADPKKIKAGGKIDFKKVNITSATMAKPLENLNGTITFNNQLIKASNFTMKIGKSDLALNFSLENYLGMAMPELATGNPPYATMSLTSKNLYMDDIVSESNEGEKSETKGENKSGSMLPPINADINAAIDKLTAKKFVFTNVKGNVKLRDGVLDLQNLSLNTFNGAVTTSGTLDMRSPDRLPFDLNLQMKAMDAHAMLPQFTSFGNQVFGNFSMSGKMTGFLNDTLGLDPKTLNGGGDLSLLNGKITGYPATATLASFTGISELKELAFNSWNGMMTIKDGRIVFDPTNIKAKQNDLILSGSQGFDGSLDFDLKVKVPESQFSQLKIQGFAADLVQYLKDDQGKINLDFDIGGTYKNPTLSLDKKPLEDAAKAALQAKLDEQQKKLEDEAKDKVKDALKDLLGK